MIKSYFTVYLFILLTTINTFILVYLVLEKRQTCVHPYSEYQLKIEEDYLLVEDWGRTIVILPLSETCTLGAALQKDKE